jgi:hypothetical protein
MFIDFPAQNRKKIVSGGKNVKQSSVHANEMQSEVSLNLLECH